MRHNETSLGPKQFILCFDGTGNKFQGDESGLTLISSLERVMRTVSPTIRGSWKTQLRMLLKCRRDEVHPLLGTTGQLPGTVYRYWLRWGLLFFRLEQDWTIVKNICTIIFVELISIL